MLYAINFNIDTFEYKMLKYILYCHISSYDSEQNHNSINQKENIYFHINCINDPSLLNLNAFPLNQQKLLNSADQCISI